jgi:rubrerythrin
VGWGVRSHAGSTPPALSLNECLRGRAFTEIAIKILCALTIVFYSLPFVNILPSSIDEMKGGPSLSQTENNLREAFAGESQANRKYLAFAAKADADGYPQAAKLFRAAAAAETIHAHAHLRALGEIGSTAENLKAAVNGETEEFESMYPGMIKTAEAEGQKAALRSFTYANEVEKVHADLYQNALDNLDSMATVDYYVCSVCGFTCEVEPPDTCPVCGAKAKAFAKVD